MGQIHATGLAPRAHSAKPMTGKVLERKVGDFSEE